MPVNFAVLTRGQMFWVALAGPAANLLMAAGLAAAFHLFHLQAVPALGNFVLLAILFNLILAVFNLIPVPPLDGSRMVYAQLKSEQAIVAYRKFSQYGLFILIAFLFFGGFRILVWPVVGLLYTLLALPLPALTLDDVSAQS